MVIFLYAISESYPVALTFYFVVLYLGMVCFSIKPDSSVEF